jgi:hypothetical protein
MNRKGLYKMVAASSSEMMEPPTGLHCDITQKITQEEDRFGKSACCPYCKNKISNGVHCSLLSLDYLRPVYEWNFRHAKNKLDETSEIYVSAE